VLPPLPRRRLPSQHRDRVELAGEEPAECAPVHDVAVGLELVDRIEVRRDALHRLEAGDELDGLIGHVDQEVGLLLQLGNGLGLAVAELELVHDLEHIVHDVVELLGEGVVSARSNGVTNDVSSRRSSSRVISSPRRSQPTIRSRPPGSPASTSRSGRAASAAFAAASAKSSKNRSSIGRRRNRTRPGRYSPFISPVPSRRSRLMPSGPH